MYFTPTEHLRRARAADLKRYHHRPRHPWVDRTERR